MWDTCLSQAAAIGPCDCHHYLVFSICKPQGNGSPKPWLLCCLSRSSDYGYMTAAWCRGNGGGCMTIAPCLDLYWLSKVVLQGAMHIFLPLVLWDAWHQCPGMFQNVTLTVGTADLGTFPSDPLGPNPLLLPPLCMSYFKAVFGIIFMLKIILKLWWSSTAMYLLLFYSP